MWHDKKGQDKGGGGQKYLEVIRREDKDIFANQIVKHPHPDDHTNKLTLCPLSLKYLKMHVNTPKDSVVDQDVSCDSKFMLSSMKKIGKAI